MSNSSQESLLTSARREMLTSAAIWLVTLVWSVGYCAKYGYHLKKEELTFVLGFPSWIFWGVILPWGLCTAVSGMYAFGFMQDADLGDTDDAPQPTGDDDAAK